MVDLVDEVNEEMRREKVTRFWQRVGGYVIAASATIIVATVSVVAWQNYTLRKQTEATEAFLEADKTLKAWEYENAARQFSALAMKDANGLPTLAAMKQAYAHTKAGKDDKALESYLALADNASADAGMRAMARIYAAQIMIGEEDKTLEDVVAVLQPLTGDKTHPFSAIAREQLAYASLRYGDEAMASRLLGELATDAQAPVSLRRRAEAQAQEFAPATAPESAPDTATAE